MMDRQELWKRSMPLTIYGKYIEEQLNSFIRKFNEVIIYGTGAAALPLFDMLSDRYSREIYFCDKKAETEGYFYQNRRVISPTELYKIPTLAAGIIISSDKYGDEIKKELAENHIDENAICHLKIKWADMFEQSERRICFGERNADKTFYIIRNVGNAGLMSHFLVNIGHVSHAVSKGYIPLVDMKNYRNGYLNYDEMGSVNAWEYYFEQPFGNNYTLDEVYESKNVIFCGLNAAIERPDANMKFLNDIPARKFWKEIYEKYIPANIDIVQTADAEYSKILKPIQLQNKKILGVLLRGTDYWELKPKDHPVQPDIMTAIEEIEKAMNRWECQYLFLVTEDITIVRVVRHFFGEKAIISRQQELAYQGGYVINSKNGNNRQRGTDYLVALLLLTKCNCFIGGRTSGSVALSVMKTDFEQESFFDYGYY